MDSMYVLRQLYDTAQKVRKAQKEYYACREPFDSPMKKQYLAEARRREQDLDKLLDQLPKVIPKLKVAAAEH